ASGAHRLVDERRIRRGEDVERRPLLDLGREHAARPEREVDVLARVLLERGADVRERDGEIRRGSHAKGLARAVAWPFVRVRCAPAHSQREAQGEAQRYCIRERSEPAEGWGPRKTALFRGGEARIICRLGARASRWGVSA